VSARGSLPPPSHLHAIAPRLDGGIHWGNTRLTEAGELIRWFPLDARVEPGPGGSVYLSWLNEFAATTEIQVWDPPHHLRTAWSFHDEDQPTQVTDYYIETKGGRTVVRAVTSGFPLNASWDGWVEGTTRGWAFELRSLKPSEPDRLVWVDCEMTGLDLGKDALIERAVELEFAIDDALRPGVDLTVVRLLVLDRRQVVDGGVEALFVVPVHPGQGREFEFVDGAEWAVDLDALGLVEADHGLGHGVVVAVADRPDRGFDAGLGEPLGVTQ
jgi:uncharacterized protein YndB with AHSA1/START domain